MNHVDQRLVGPDLVASQVMEFGLSLDGPPTTWQPLTTFTTFDSLAAHFKKLFQRRVPLKQLCIAYYSAMLVEGEHITNYYMRFQTLMQHVPTPPSEEDRINTFI